MHNTEDSLSRQPGLVVQKNMKELLESVGITRAYSKGEIIYHQGDNAESFFLLKKGKVKVFMTSVDGMEKILNTATSGELLGEGAFFDKQPRVSSASAVTNSELVVIDKSHLEELIAKYPSLALGLLEILANRIRLLSAQLDSMTFMNADSRIAKLLLESEVRGNVKFTHEEIANAVGVSRVTVSKALGRFAKNGCVCTEYGYVKIADRNKLKACVTSINVKDIKG